MEFPHSLYTFPRQSLSNPSSIEDSAIPLLPYSPYCQRENHRSWNSFRMDLAGFTIYTQHFLHGKSKCGLFDVGISSSFLIEAAQWHDLNTWLTSSSIREHPKHSGDMFIPLLQRRKAVGSFSWQHNQAKIWMRRVFSFQIQFQLWWVPSTSKFVGHFVGELSQCGKFPHILVIHLVQQDSW